MSFWRDYTDCVSERDALRARLAAVEQENERVWQDFEYTKLRLAEVERALSKVNDIRNSIIGLQKVNWSEHVYPLVAALNEAGVRGLDYPEAMVKYGTMLERATTAEARAEALAAQLAKVERERDTVQAYRRREHEHLSVDCLSQGCKRLEYERKAHECERSETR